MSQLCSEELIDYFQAAKHCAVFIFSHLNCVFSTQLTAASVCTLSAVKPQLSMTTSLPTTVKHQNILSS